MEYKKNSFDISNPKFLEDREKSGLRADEALNEFRSSNEIQGLLNRRRGLYLILLKAILLREQKDFDLSKKMEELIEFSLIALGAFAKTEIYFAWKMFKYEKDLKFFQPISQLGKNSLHKIRGMAWDLFAIRYQEALTRKSNIGDFYVPFFASFDNKFIELAHACPIRAVLIDDIDNRVVTIFIDEYEFLTDLNKSITADLSRRLHDPAEKLKRLSNELSEEELELKTNELELAIEEYY